MPSDRLDEPAPYARTDKVPLGIAYMVGATLMFAVTTALGKWLVAIYPFTEILLFRSTVSVLIAMLMILPRTGLVVFRTRLIAQHASRSVVQALAQSCMIVALSLMPIAGAVAINFSSPLFATLFTFFLLGEKIGLERGVALVAGFLGVLLVVSPGADSFTMGALFALGNAVLFASVTTAVRGMSNTESAETLTLYQMGFMALLFALATPFFGFTMPTMADAAAMVALGVVNSFGQYWWTRALSLAPPSATGPFYYFSLVWAIALGYLFWGDVPTPALLAGSAIVVASGLILLWREAGRKRETAQDINVGD